MFSDSQLNALGLASFLARTIREGSGFVILDDPVPATDKEHRGLFINKVLEELLREKVQVILLTHDEKMRKDVEELYDHFGIDVFNIVMNNPVKGSFVKKTHDTLEGKLILAKRYLSCQDYESRKSAAHTLRDAAERYCKLMLVHDRRRRGENFALVTDYDGQNLINLIRKTEPILKRDPSHPGKLHYICRTLSPGSHDDEVPTHRELKQCLDHLKNLKDIYHEGKWKDG